jgi:hypothetical protein
MSIEAVKSAMDEHTLYVNRCADRSTDPHFADIRLDELIRS